MHAARFAPFAREAEHGEFVKFFDYEVLKADRDALAQRIERLSGMLTESRVATKSAEERADALAVENQALKSAHPQPFGREMMKALDAYERHQDEVPETGMLDAFFILRDSIRVETPATSAALAAIQAQGVEKFADHMQGGEKYSRIAEYARGFATELREAK